MSSASHTGFVVERRDEIFIITLQNGAENRLNSAICRSLIGAFHSIQKELGPGSPGAVITRGHNFKHWCTGIDLSEGDSNPFASTDGFYPVATHCPKDWCFSDTVTAASYHSRLPVSNNSLHNRPYFWRRMSPRACSRLPHHE